MFKQYAESKMNTNQYTHRYPITAADMDTRYRMTPNAVLLYYQDCWARYMSCLHLAAFDVVKHNLLWIITEFNAYFEQETVLWSDDIEVTVWNSEVSALRCYADFRIHRSDGTEVAHGYGCWNLIDMKSHRLAPTTALPLPLPVLDEMTTEEHRKRRFTGEGAVLQTIEHHVNPMNVDFNGHVNNRTYMSIAMQSADEAFMDKFTIRCMAIHWLHESFMGDTIKCRLTLLPNDINGEYHYLHTMTRNETEITAQIYSEWPPRTVHHDVCAEAARK